MVMLETEDTVIAHDDMSSLTRSVVVSLLLLLESPQMNMLLNVCKMIPHCEEVSMSMILLV